MTIITQELNFSTQGHTEIVDITKNVEEAVKKSNISDGLVTVFVVGSTASISTIEYEPGLVKDLGDAFERLMPEKMEYAHNKAWGDFNGSAHIRAAFLGSNRSFPMKDKKMILGTWQQIILIDFDNRPRERRIIVQIVGE